MDDILSQIIAYAPDKIDTELKAAALVQGSRNMDQEPRNMYNQGSSVDHAIRTIDPVQDSGNKIEEVLKAYGRYQGNRKGKPMSFSKFFQLYAPENFATGGSAGQLVQPNNDGSRPGYAGDRKIYKVIREVTDVDRIQAANKGSPIPKDAKYKVQLPSSTMQIDELGKEVKKTGTKMQYAKTKNILQKAIDKSDNYRTSGQLSKDISDRMMGNTKGFKIGNKTGVQFGSGQTSSITPEMLKVNTDIIDEIIKTKSLDVKKLAGKFDMSLKDMNQKLSNFTRAYYKNRIGEGGVYLNKYDDGVLSKVLGKLNASDFKNQYERTMTELVSQAYPKGSKNLTAAIDNVKNYHKTNLLIAEKFPSLYSTLDHSVPYTYIRDITEAGGNPKNLIKVRPLPKEANTFKTLIDRRSINLGKKLKENPKDAKLLKDFKNLNFIKKQIPLEFGTTTSGGKVVSYANQALSGKTDLVDGIVKGNAQFNELIDFSKNLDPESDLSKLLTKSEKSQLNKISTVTKVDEKDLKTLLADLGCPKSLQKASGGRIKYSKGTTCSIKGRDILEKGLKNGFPKNQQGDLARKILGSGKFLKDAVSLRGLFGPAALAFTVAAEAGFVGYDMLSTGKSFKEAVGSSLFNYMLGDKTKIDSVEERDKRMVAEGITPEQMGKIKYFDSMMSDMQTGSKNYNTIKDLEKKIEDNTLNQQVNSEFPDQAFQLNTQLDKAQAENQDYFRTNKVGGLENYFTIKEDGTMPFMQGGETLAEGLRRNELAQLQSVDNPLQSRKGDEKRSARIRELMLQNPDVRNYMGDYPTNYGFMEGGIASLNVKK